MMCSYDLESCQMLLFSKLFLFTIYRYNSVYAYGQSKLANILHANDLAKRLQVLDIHQSIIQNVGISLVVSPCQVPFYDIDLICEIMLFLNIQQLLIIFFLPLFNRKKGWR